jgi:uncharacterized protein DUF642/PEP-CTERM motif-containing protein
MCKVLHIVVLLIVVATMVPMASADAVLNNVQNGTFSTPATFSNSGYITIAAGSTALPGWTVGGSVDVVSGSGNLWQAAPGGGNSIDLSGNAAGSLASQVLTTVPGGSLWTISFYLAGNYASSIDKTVQVSLGSQFWTYVVAGGNTPQNMNWQLVTISNVLINPGWTTLTFSSLTPGYYGPVVADISLFDPPAPTSVPEPAGLVLLSTGLMGIAGLRKAWLR